MNWTLVLEFVFERGRLLSQIGDNDARIVHVAYDDGADVIRDREDVGDAIRHDQFIGNLLLAAHDNAVLAADRDGRLAERLHGLEGVLLLVDSAVSGENLHGLFLRHCVLVLILRGKTNK